MRRLLRIALWVGVLIVGYFVVSLNFETPSSDKARLEYSNIKGHFESIDFDRIGAGLEEQGSNTFNSLSALLGEVWESASQAVTDISKGLSSAEEIKTRIDSNPQFAASVPAIMPINRSELKGEIGAYGFRIHPIKVRIIKHNGIDLSCDMGRVVYATGSGVVERSEQGKASVGYGEMILLNHGFGYKSRYAHLSARYVTAGDRVERGDVIGLVGSTGGSTGPHLHYEVIVEGRAVNPEKYLTLISSVQ